MSNKEAKKPLAINSKVKELDKMFSLQRPFQGQIGNLMLLQKDLLEGEMADNIGWKYRSWIITRIQMVIDHIKECEQDIKNTL